MEGENIGSLGKIAAGRIIGDCSPLLVLSAVVAGVWLREVSRSRGGPYDLPPQFPMLRFSLPSIQTIRFFSFFPTSKLARLLDTFQGPRFVAARFASVEECLRFKKKPHRTCDLLQSNTNRSTYRIKQNSLCTIGHNRSQCRRL
jgi:hypothetical protein